MPIPLDASGFETEDDAHQGGRVNRPGSYHVRITRVDDTCETYQAVVVTFHVLNGTVSDQCGKDQVVFFNTDESKKSQREMKALFVAAGILKLGEKFNVYFDHEPASSDCKRFKDLLDCELIIVVQEWTNKEGELKLKVWDEMYSLDYEGVKTVPRGVCDGGEESTVSFEEKPPEPRAEEASEVASQAAEARPITWGDV
jgi:hypothetical protein